VIGYSVNTPPVVMVPIASVKEPQFGQIRTADRCYGLYRQYLKRTVDDQFAVFLPP